jgi:hypothetical protein
VTSANVNVEYIPPLSYFLRLEGAACSCMGYSIVGDQPQNVVEVGNCSFYTMKPKKMCDNSHRSKRPWLIPFPQKEQKSDILPIALEMEHQTPVHFYAMPEVRPA